MRFAHAYLFSARTKILRAFPLMKLFLDFFEIGLPEVASWMAEAEGWAAPASKLAGCKAAAKALVVACVAAFRWRLILLKFAFFFCLSTSCSRAAAFDCCF
jgi:hypothetical protein